MLTVATAQGLYLVSHKFCVVVAPPADHNRAVCAVWPQTRQLKVGVWVESIEAFLGVPQDQARAIMGQATYRYVTGDDVIYFNNDLKRLLAASSQN